MKSTMAWDLSPHFLPSRMTTSAYHAMRAIRSRLNTIDEMDEAEELICTPTSPEGTKFKILMRKHPTAEKFMVICEKEDGSANIDGWLTEERANDTISWWQKHIQKGGHVLASLFEAD